MIGNLLGVLKQISSSASTQLFKEVFDEVLEPPLDKLETDLGTNAFFDTALALPGFLASTSYAPGPGVSDLLSLNREDVE